MTTLVRKVLFVAVAMGEESRFKALLSRYGYHLVIAKSPVVVRAQCRANDFDFIFTGSSNEGQAETYAEEGYPIHIPILCLSKSPKVWTNRPDILCVTPEVSDETFFSQCALLSKIRDLRREVTDKDRRISSLKLALGQQQQSMKQHSDFLDVLASRDGLTGLYNRRHLNTVLSREFKHYLEQETDMSLLIFDLDFFDELNKKAGRTYGDFVLNDFAARLTRITTPKGICFRFSGEIFVTLLPETNLNEAIDLAETVRQNLIENPFIQGDLQHNITISVGIASMIEHQPEDPDHFITMAERALFAAKAEGRNRVLVYNRIIEQQSDDSSQQSMAIVKETLTRILDKTRKSAIESLQLLAKDIAGKENLAHVKAVRHYVDLICRHMNLTEPLIRTFKNAITLHSSIRLLLHNEMINKHQDFSSDEREEMNDFPYKLLELTELFDFFAGERTILLHHAERFDGYGSPEGLKGDEIPLGARIFALVDALAAMNADRPYRKRLPPEDIIEQLITGAGTQFDPQLVRRALEIIKNHQLFDVDHELIDRSISIIESLPSSVHHE